MNHWDEKFDSDNYIYGEEANEFVKNIFQTNTTNNENIVLFAEGEGRNASLPCTTWLRCHNI